MKTTTIGTIGAVITGALMLSGSILLSSTGGPQPPAQVKQIGPRMTTASQPDKTPNSSLATVPPEAASQITIGWVQSTSINIVMQTIGWGTASGDYAYFLNVDPNQTKFTITGLMPATTYFISVYASQSLGLTGTNWIRSPWGTECSATTYPTQRPAPPTDINVISQP